MRAVLWGATGQAKVLRECLARQGVGVVAVADNDRGVAPPFRDCPLIIGPTAFREWLAQQANPLQISALVAVGGARGQERLELQEWLLGLGLRALTAVHPTAFVAPDVVLGAGSQVLAQAGVCVEARLGRTCIVNTGATVDHECLLGDGVHVAPGAHLAGLVEVGAFAMVGMGAVVLPRRRIGEGAVVGAGAVVVEDVLPGQTVVGNPARPIREERRR